MTESISASIAVKIKLKGCLTMLRATLPGRPDLISWLFSLAAASIFNYPPVLKLNIAGCLSSVVHWQRLLVGMWEQPKSRRRCLFTINHRISLDHSSWASWWWRSRAPQTRWFIKIAVRRRVLQGYQMFTREKFSSCFHFSLFFSSARLLKKEIYRENVTVKQTIYGTWRS